MGKKKYKKDIKFWGQFKDSVISKGAKEEINRIKKRYNDHRIGNNKPLTGE